MSKIKEHLINQMEQNLDDKWNNLMTLRGLFPYYDGLETVVNNFYGELITFKVMLHYYVENNGEIE